MWQSTIKLKTLQFSSLTTTGPVLNLRHVIVMIHTVNATHVITKIVADLHRIARDVTIVPTGVTNRVLDTNELFVMSEVSVTSEAIETSVTSATIEVITEITGKTAITMELPGNCNWML